MAVSGIAGVGATSFVPPTLQPQAAPKSNVFAEGLKQVQSLENNADVTAAKLATGELTDVHEFTTAAAKAQLGISLTAALRNKAVEAYQEIMRMQV
jgi:flagellar hook-basal body complex protein FliE